MQAIKQLYRVGYGPSSSHTIAPFRIAGLYKEQFPGCDSYKVLLGGSLALTAMGHGTINIIKKALATDQVEFTFDHEDSENDMFIQGFRDEEAQTTWHGLSLGGGAIRIQEYDAGDDDEVYEENSFDAIKKVLEENGISLIEYIYGHESDLKEYLKGCLKVMFETVERGLVSEGLINKELKYYRVAAKLYEKARSREDFLVAYSYAACEENAAGGMMCTAPTLGACGILTSLMYYLHKNEGVNEDELCDYLAVAGIFGNCIKKNASIAGSTGGCQAEVGTACSMAAAAIAFKEGFDLPTIEYAAEMGIEHFLGLTCDPVLGYVIIPCIERNAISILRAYDCAYLAEQLKDVKGNLISFDSVVHAMNYTGNKLAIELKETSLGGLSLEYKYAKR
ncbi:MAG: L-serine ammonia-lyase, iron-sulfur-dependent, subunit alpha [Erysipelotrichaceae bacterium]|nr:L-serine ammonia-lyase, iron-sulfur-dependent, subunit alpha [Erysipelotrichaceae bacterium]